MERCSRLPFYCSVQAALSQHWVQAGVLCHVLALPAGAKTSIGGARYDEVIVHASLLGGRVAHVWPRRELLVSRLAQSVPEVEKAGRSEASRCIVHSWGSRGEVSFENAVQALAPSCEIHIFDHSKPIRPVPRGGSARAVQYHCTWLGPQWKVDKHDLPGDPLMMTLETAMKSLGQTYVDVLKVELGQDLDLADAPARGEKPDLVPGHWNRHFY